MPGTIRLTARAMSERLLFIDTDMLVLLGGSGTLPAALALLGFLPDQVRRLAAAPHQLERSRRFKDTYPAPVLQAARRAAAGIAPVSEQPADDALVDQLARVSDVDLGEAELIALLAEHDGFYLTTGDKRALVALATDHGLADVRARVAGRLICLESILKRLVQDRGAGAMAKAFAAVMTHRTIGVLFTEAQVRSDDVCLEGIESYLNDLIQKTGEGFLYLP